MVPGTSCKRIGRTNKIKKYKLQQHFNTAKNLRYFCIYYKLIKAYSLRQRKKRHKNTRVTCLGRVRGRTGELRLTIFLKLVPPIIIHVSNYLLMANKKEDNRKWMITAVPKKLRFQLWTAINVRNWGLFIISQNNWHHMRLIQRAIG